MSNAADDPGHRPPPPRQGDPQHYPGGPYPGGSQPHPGDPYHGAPQPYGDPPYAGGQQPYQGGGYASPPSPYAPAPSDVPPQPTGQVYPAYRPASAGGSGKSFFGALFDANFDQMITVRLARTIYMVILLLVTLFALVVLWYGLSFLSWNTALGVMTIVAAPLIWLFDVVMVRVFMEFVINQFKITEHLKAIREQREPR